MTDSDIRIIEQVRRDDNNTLLVKYLRAPGCPLSTELRAFIAERLEAATGPGSYRPSVSRQEARGGVKAFDRLIRETLEGKTGDYNELLVALALADHPDYRPLRLAIRTLAGTLNPTPADEWQAFDDAKAARNKPLMEALDAARNEPPKGKGQITEAAKYLAAHSFGIPIKELKKVFDSRA